MQDRATLRAAEKAMDSETALRQVLAVALAERCGCDDEELQSVRSWYAEPTELPAHLRQTVALVAEWRAFGLWPLAPEDLDALASRHRPDLVRALDEVASLVQPPGWP